MSSVFGGGYEEAAALSGVQGFGPEARDQRRPRPAPALAEEPHEGVVAIAALNRIERELRRIRSFTAEYGRQYSRVGGGQLPAGAGTLAFPFEGPKSGNDWYVERLTISVSGASAAGTVALFVGSLGDGTPDEGQLLDFLPALSGNSPSRGTLDGRGTPYFVYGGAPVVVLIAGAVNGSSVFLRLQGREVLAGADPALRSQDDF